MGYELDVRPCCRRAVRRVLPAARAARSHPGRGVDGMITELLAQIEGNKRGKYFNCGIVLWNDQVVEAAPIVSFMKRWSRDRVRDYCREQGWKVSVVEE